MENTQTGQANTTSDTTFTSEARFYAQPYDISARGFFFVGMEDYRARVTECRNAYGDPVEEFEIQFIDGNDLDAALFEALSVSQATLETYIEALDTWTDEEKVRLIIAVGEAGYTFDFESQSPDDIEVDIYPDMTLSDLAYQFIDEGLFGDLSDKILMYLDYDLIARDLGHDYTETTIAGVTYTYRAA